MTDPAPMPGEGTSEVVKALKEDVKNVLKSKMEKFDFTNKQGLQKIFSVLRLRTLGNPTVMLATYVIDKITDLTKSWEVQRDTIERLIQKGRENGTDEMEIVINNKRGFKFNVPMEGTTIDTLIGADEKMHIKVKYK